MKKLIDYFVLNGMADSNFVSNGLMNISHFCYGLDSHYFLSIALVRSRSQVIICTSRRDAAFKLSLTTFYMVPSWAAVHPNWVTVCVCWPISIEMKRGIEFYLSIGWCCEGIEYGSFFNESLWKIGLVKNWDQYDVRWPNNCFYKQSFERQICLQQSPPYFLVWYK